MKATTNLTLKKYQKTLEEAVKASTKLNTARKALIELPSSWAIKTALEEITGKQEHYDRVARNTTHNISVLKVSLL